MIQAIGLTSTPRRNPCTALRRHGVPDGGERNGPRPLVDDVSLTAPQGRVTALLAPWAVGSTVVRLMLDLEPGRGVTRFRGRPLRHMAHPLREVGVLLGDVPGHPGRTVRGHLRMLCAAAGLPAARADAVLEEIGLVSLREEPLGNLSRGLDRQLGLACALLGEPHTLVLDAPFRGLAPREARWLHGQLRRYTRRGGTVLLTTADAGRAAKCADRVVVLDDGRIVADQEAATFASTRLRPRVAVRSPHAARLGMLLAKEARVARRSVEVVQEDGTRLSVYGSSCAHVGETAFRHGILIHHLADECGAPGRETPGVSGTDEASGGATGCARRSDGSPVPRNVVGPAPPGSGPSPTAGPPPPSVLAPAAPGASPADRATARAEPAEPASAHGAPTPQAPCGPGAPSVPSEPPVLSASPAPAVPRGATRRPPVPSAPIPSGATPKPSARTSTVGSPGPGPKVVPLPSAKVTVRRPRNPLCPVRYELCRSTGVVTGYLVAAGVLVVSAVLCLLMAVGGSTSEPYVLAAWPRELPLPPAALGAGLLGALAYGDEFRYPALAVDRGTVPRRFGLLGAKLFVAAVTALLLACATLGCDAAVLHLVPVNRPARSPVDPALLGTGWVCLVVGCAWVGVAAAGVFRAASAGLAAVLAVPLLAVPVVGAAVGGAPTNPAVGALGRSAGPAAGMPGPPGSEGGAGAAIRWILQPMGSALMLSLVALLCAFMLMMFRDRAR